MTCPDTKISDGPLARRRGPVRRIPVGAEPQPGGGVHFRLWAPQCNEVSVEIEGIDPALMSHEPDGYFSCWPHSARAGMRYRFRLDRSDKPLPDPASRLQPDGPHGPSEIVDPDAFAWSDGAWRGLPREQLVVYELHVGTFTHEGSWQAAVHELSALARLGITCIEIMPVAEFSGGFGWGW